jgi:hypothetical protein
MWLTSGNSRMTLSSRCLRTVCAFAAFVSMCVSASDLVHPDHFEFDATIEAPFQAQAGRWPIRIQLEYPGAGRATQAAWMIRVLDHDQDVVRHWSAITAMVNGSALVETEWNGRDASGHVLAPGYYTLELRAVPTINVSSDNKRSIDERVAEALATFADEEVEQRHDVMVGDVAPASMPAFHPLAVGARAANPKTSSSGQTAGKSTPAAGLGYTIYYGNLHSQTNHSDGGGNLATCSGAQNPQSGQYGPADAYAMMRDQAGGDFLLASEHNHMYDGSTGTNASASPAAAIALFDSGLQAASNYRAAHPDFLALYGLEWGVISNGGHLNLINPDALAEWETNSSGQLIGEVNTPKSNYPALYATMKQRGWIGQFNHPASSGQFLVNGTALGYDANGAEVMVLAEVLNSSAYSTNTTETESSRSSYVKAWNTLLERGYKLAPSSSQDNHCANWGLSFSNRTGVLLASAVTLTPTAFFDALRSRRAFASEDRSGQLILLGNGHIMGESFSNSGALTLVANFASTSGKTVQRLQFFEGVPGRNGTVSQLAEGNGNYSFTPAIGAHFYYALVTQSNGLRLWSAPVWVDQQATGGDSIPPTVSVSVSGSSGVITLAANASDNVGVVRVEFSIDGTLRGSDTSTPYAIAFDSTALANGSHALTAKAFDVAGNSTTSSAVVFSISNLATPVEQLTNGGFESGSSNWTASSGVITNSSSYTAHSGIWRAWLNGYGSTHTDYAWQAVTIPASAAQAVLSFWLRVDSSETTTTNAYDTFAVQLRNSSNQIVATLGSYSNLDKGSSYVQRSFDLIAYKGQTLRVYFEGKEGSRVATSFVVDDVSLMTR